MPTYRLLHLEDTPADAALVMRALRRGGVDADIRWVTDKEEFQAALDQGGWDAVLVDYDLQGFTGGDALSMTRRKEPPPPVIVVSGAVGEEIAADLIRKGAVNFVSKANITRLPVALIRAIRDSHLLEETHRLQKRLELMSMAVAQSASMVIITDAEGLIEYVNPKFTEVSGYTLDDLAGCTPKVLRSDKTNPILTETLVEAKKTGRHWHGCLINRRRDGTLYYVSASIAPVVGPGGTITHFVAIQEDITEQRKAEEALRQSETRLRSIAASARDAIVVVDETGHIVAWNQGAETTFGYSTQAAVGMEVGTIIPDHIRADHDRMIARAATLHHTTVDHPMITCQALRRDGREIPVEISLGSWAADGQMFFCAVIRDITARKQGEAELLAAKESAERANQAKTVFLSHVSHELRTPLNAILGYSEMLALGYTGTLAPNSQSCAENIVTSGQHLLSIIEELLDISRIELGTYTITPADLDLPRLIDDCIAMMAPQVAAKRLTLTFPRPLPVTIRSDGRALRQVLINVIGNAVKYTPSGGSITVTVDFGTETIVRVGDTGQGIPSDHLETVFEPFHRADPLLADPSRGVGLGLAICRRILGLLGGTIWATSSLGIGTTMTISLPSPTRHQGSSAPEDVQNLRIMHLDSYQPPQTGVS